jgi:CheY-like chemotaxis protein
MSAGSDPIRILTVDDHPLLRAGIEALVSSQADMLVVAECSNGRDAIQQFRTHRPDVTLMDLQMPEMSGTDAIIAAACSAPAGQTPKPGAPGSTQVRPIPPPSTSGPLQVTDLYHLKSVGDVRLSPDGTRVAYTVTRIGSGAP